MSVVSPVLNQGNHINLSDWAETDIDNRVVNNATRVLCLTERDFSTLTRADLIELIVSYCHNYLQENGVPVSKNILGNLVSAVKAFYRWFNTDEDGMYHVENDPAHDIYPYEDIRRVLGYDLPNSNGLGSSRPNMVRQSVQVMTSSPALDREVKLLKKVQQASISRNDKLDLIETILDGMI